MVLIAAFQRWVFPSFITVCFLANSALAQSTAFTYQGKLTDGGNPANGSYDLQFALFDSLSGGTQIGSTLTRSSTAVSGGIFTVQLDFGVSAFPGANRFLEIAVRPAAVGNFTTLSPRQPISSTPYAIRSLNAATADAATNSTQLGGVAANQYVQTNDSRLTDARPPTANSANYIQNTKSQQTANFNISGDGSVAGKVGIGTSDPAVRLDVRGNGSDCGALFSFGDIPNAIPCTTALVLYSSIPGAYLVEGIDQFGPRVLIRSDGEIDTLAKIGIGKLFPRASLDVASGGETQTSYTARFQSSPNVAGAGGILFDQNSTYGWKMHTEGTGNPDGSLSFSAVNISQGYVVGDLRTLVLTAGRVGINMRLDSNPTATLHVNGNIRTELSGTLAATHVCWDTTSRLLSLCSSSARFKSNVSSLRNGLGLINRLRPVAFNWKSDGKPDLGLIAEEVAVVEPRLVTRDDNGKTVGVKYDGLTAVLINAIKEQQTQIDRQQKELQQLRKEMRRLRVVKRQSGNRR